jgi:hypothetical protein
VGRPTPELLARARVFSIAFAVLAVVGLALSVVIPLTVPGPKWLTIALGSGCLILLLVLGGKLLRRIVMGGPKPGA